MRLGVVLDHGGGALEEMTKSFRFGVATWLGLLVGMVGKVVLAFVMVGIFVVALLV